MKKIIGLLLCVCMVFGMNTGVMAYSDVEEGTCVSEAVSVLSDLSVFNGFEDGSFQPEATVTRAQMAKVICEILGYSKVASTTTNFTDVPAEHWASGYINTINGLGIINGYGNGMYGPEDTVSYEQAVKMVVCALGYEPMAISKGGWSAGYISVASSIKLTEGVYGSTRGDIAVLVYNAINTPVMEQTAYGSEIKYEILNGTSGREYKTLLNKNDIYKVIGLVGEASATEITLTVSENDSNIKLPATIKVGSSNVKDYTYQEVELYVAKDGKNFTVVAVKPAETVEKFLLVSDDIVDITTGDKYDIVEYYVGTKTKKIYVNKDATIEYNKNIVDELEIKDDIELVFVDNDSDNRYDVIIATEYTSAIVDNVDIYREKMSIDGKTIEFDFDNEDKTYIFVDVNGKELSLSDFEEEDVIAYIANTKIQDADYIKIVKLNNAAVEGVVESVNDKEKTVIINDKEYKVTDNVWSDIADPGVEGMFYVGMTGKIFKFDGTIVNAKYGYILAAGVSTDTFDKTTQIKLLTVNGVKVYDLTEKVANDFAYNNVAWNEGAEVEDYRFVEYSINSKGQISKIKSINTTSEFINTEYKGKTEILNGKFIDENTLVFVLNEEKAEDTYVTDINYFVDEATYSGAMYVKNGDTKIVFVTDTDAVYNSEMGFAIVTGKGRTVNAEGNKVFYVDYVQNEVKGTIYFEDGDAKEEDFAVGTVFIYNKLANGYVNKYSIIASVNDEYNFTIINDKDLGKDIEVVFGYIYNTKRETNSKGNEIITLDNEESYVITNAVNKYTYYETSRVNIEVEDFLSGNAYYKDGDNVTAVMLKLVDGVVIDIYTISK